MHPPRKGARRTNPTKKGLSYLARVNPRVSREGPSPICIPLIVRGRGKLILHARANRRQRVTKPPVQENLLSPRMGNPNKSDQIKWHLPDKKCKNKQVTIVPGENPLSSFYFSILCTYHLPFFLLFVENVPPRNPTCITALVDLGYPLSTKMRGLLISCICQETFCHAPYAATL